MVKLRREFRQYTHTSFWGSNMTRPILSGFAVALAMLPAVGAWAADLPAIKTSAANPVAECATPGRLMAYLKSRNDKLDPRFDKIAVEYMRHGEQLGLRWDYTFFQMLLETGHLSYRGDRGRRGDVSPSQNNFAGLGATGRGAPGESFPDVPTGVLAHLQHVLVYAGERVDDPVAERTRKVQDWGILKNMQKQAKGPVTFVHLATKWAPGADYVNGIQSLARRFTESFCRSEDPNPEWVQEARGIEAKETPAVASRPVGEDASGAERISGAEIARRAIAESKAEGNNRRLGLGLGAGASAIGKPAGGDTPAYSILNAPQPSANSAAETPSIAESGAARTDKTPAFVTASAAGSLARPSLPNANADSKPTADSKPVPGKCRVWTASYGGQKALIIRVKTDKSTDYTVLDVNEGAESREAEAYISAYAKGGKIEGEFATSNQALEKAFELCPEN